MHENGDSLPATGSGCAMLLSRDDDMKTTVAIASLLAFVTTASTGFARQQTPAPNTGGQTGAADSGQVQRPVAQPRMPVGFPLDAENQKYIEQLLAYWEGTSQQVTHYQCAMTRWTYDQEVCNFRKPENNQLVAAVIARGSVRYRSPDKGMYEVTEQWQFGGPAEQPGGDPKYERRALTNKDFAEQEKWICDGRSIYEYDFQRKQITELTLPPEAQGEGLKNSPLPFVFGAKAAELLDRYWIRDVTPPNVTDQYWLEAWPKRASDAQSYSKLEIILTRDPFLPAAIHMYAPNYDPKTNPSKMVFEFRDREINGTLAGLLDRFFIRPSTPFGWERAVQDLASETGASMVDRMGRAPGNDEKSR